MPVPDVRHCWVTTVHGRSAGLLIRWRNVTGQLWEGLVVHAIPDPDDESGESWVLVEEWLPETMLDPVGT